MDFHELWETVRAFCTDNYIEIGYAAGALVLLVILVAICRSLKKKPKDGDWMDDFDARMAAFEQREGHKIATAPVDDRTMVEKIADKALERAAQRTVVAVTPAPPKPITVEAPAAAMQEAPAQASAAPVKADLSAAAEIAKAVQGDQPASFHFNIQLAEVKITCENWPEGLPPMMFQPQAVVTVKEPAPEPQVPEASLFPGDALDLDRPLKPAPDADTADVVVEKINILKRETMDEHLSVSRSGRVYSEEEIRAQIRK